MGTTTENALKTGVLVIGAGLAGLMTALTLAPKSVILLSKGPLGEEASSTWAQGGISAALSPEDSPANHLRDTLAVAGGIADEDIAALVTDLGPERIQDLIDLGVIFDQDENGLSLSREAAHSHRRVVHANGDSTGREVMRALRLRTLEASHITVLENAEALDLITEESEEAKIVGGATVFQDQQHIVIQAEAVVLATGGIGQLYSATTNPLAACGDGLAMAARAGATLKDLEFVQFHPTAIDVDATPRPLATEALRGDGAWLVNDLGERFMKAEHPLAELAPRDIVARGIWRQREAGQKCYLDTRNSIGRALPEHFPTVFSHCQDHGIDPRTDLIPVVPAAHYHMGGIEADNRGRTDIKGLWACGEVACTGLHGANRLASNSLLEALVFAPLVSKDIKDQQQKHPLSSDIKNLAVSTPPYPKLKTGLETDVIAELQVLNYRYIGLCRNAHGLETLVTHLDNLKQKYPAPSARLRNLMTVSRLVAQSALTRKESRGGHYRDDYPETLDGYKAHSRLTFDDTQKTNFEITRSPSLKMAS
ncbi:L-aspartate oxidase [Kiloniella antarctica]|uniref:L-aspartate oxidase n=1 Tax=Kiloniella antarctica TaxID=1550907 RepID=A0ABW5BGC7_9PROT